MPSENIPTQDANLRLWLTNFAAVALANATDLGLTTAQTTALTTYATLYNSKLALAETAKADSKSATQAKADAKALALELFRGYAKAILADPDVSAPLKASLGMTTATTPAAPIEPPTELTADAYSNGASKLLWKRSGNSKNVNFIVQAKFGPSSTWTIIGTTPRTTYTDENRTPGEMILYRVIAQRGIVQSLPSNQAVVYGALEAETITLQEAA